MLLARDPFKESTMISFSPHVLFLLSILSLLCFVNFLASFLCCLTNHHGIHCERKHLNTFSFDKEMCGCLCEQLGEFPGEVMCVKVRVCARVDCGQKRKKADHVPEMTSA